VAEGRTWSSDIKTVTKQVGAAAPAAGCARQHPRCWSIGTHRAAAPARLPSCLP
jgi:hypothetical protein